MVISRYLLVLVVSSLYTEEAAGCPNFSLLVGHNMNDMFAWVEFHLLGVLPFSESHGLLEVGPSHIGL